MKKTFTRLSAVLLPAVLALFNVQQANAQDDVDVVGYTNVYIRVKAAPQGGGQVFPFYQEASSKVWRDEWDFKQPIPVGSVLNVNISLLFLYAKANTGEGYTFGGWYLDDGDGVFDVEKDEFLSDNESYVNMAALDDDAVVYDTQAQARNGSFPNSPTDLIFAYFTRGARVDLSYYQDDYLDLHANCGTVWISNTTNEPGDEVTVRAIANDGFHFEYWQDADYLGNIVSRENPYTFTVKGGECLYAYFVADDAPEFDLPEEGGFTVAVTDKPWVLTDESIKDGALVLVMEQEDLTRNDGKVYLDKDKEDSHYSVTQWLGAPTIIYGKGKVRFAYKMKYGSARSRTPLVNWSGDKGTTLSGDVIYVYVFVPELGAFIQYGTTDDYNPSATPTVNVPAKQVYISLSAFDLTDDEGNIPTVIGLSPETYDAGVAGRDSALEILAGIGGVELEKTQLKGRHVYTLSGVEVKTTAEKGVYIVNGRKVVIR